MGGLFHINIKYCAGTKHGVFHTLADWEGDGAVIFREVPCILSSKNPWFCQSKFLGIATEIPW